MKRRKGKKVLKLKRHLTTASTEGVASEGNVTDIRGTVGAAWVPPEPRVASSKKPTNDHQRAVAEFEATITELERKLAPHKRKPASLKRKQKRSKR